MLSFSSFLFTATQSYDNFVTLVVKDRDKAGLKYQDDYIAESEFTIVPGSEAILGELFIIIIQAKQMQNS